MWSRSRCLSQVTFRRCESRQVDYAVGCADGRPDPSRVGCGDLGCDADRFHGEFGLLCVWVFQVDGDEFAVGWEGRCRVRGC